MTSFKAFMTYLTSEQHQKLKKFSKRNNIAISAIIRESTDAFLRGDDQYSQGYNAGLRKAMQLVEEHKASKMRFPSGKSFAELINDDIRKLMIYEVKDEGKTATETHAAGGSESSPTGSRQDDPDLGL